MTKETPVPSSQTELSSFLCLDGYYSRYIQVFGDIFASAVSVKVTFKWAKEMQVDFDQIKSKLTSDKVLVFPEFYAPFRNRCFWYCSHSLHAVITQNKPKGGVKFCKYLK